MNIKDGISKELNDLIAKTNQKICENFDIEYFYNFDKNQNDSKRWSIQESVNIKHNLIKDNSIELNECKIVDIPKEHEKLQEQIKRNNKNIEKCQKTIKLLKIIFAILIIFALINIAAMIFIIYKMYIDPKNSFELYFFPSFFYVQFLIYSIFKYHIIGFDNYEMKKVFNLIIYYYNFLILICSIWGLVVHTESSHLIFFSCFLSFTWLTNIFCKFYISSKKYKLDKFIKKFILLEILKWTDLNIEQYMQERFNILNEFRSMFKKRFNRALKQSRKSRKDKYWDFEKTWQIMFCNINRELNLLKNQYKFN